MKISLYSKKGQLINNANRIAKIVDQFGAYRKLFANALINKVPIKELLITQFPFSFKDYHKPPIVSIELTNFCNLKCVYCPNPIGLRPRGYMSATTFQRLLISLEETKISRLRIVGNGENTLHPQFAKYAERLAKKCKFISMVSNGQWENINMPEILLSIPFNVIEISVDVGSAKEYENNRIGGNYERLIKNLEKLKKLKKRSNDKTQINIRLMIRPSQVDLKKKYMKFWKKYADTVMPQYVTQIKGTNYYTDIFIPTHRSLNAIPKCSLIFKNLEIRWTGQVLLCGSSVYQYCSGGLELGNINTDSIDALWNNEVIKKFRNGHRKKNYSEIEMCRSCQGY